ncbi:hypothetical protein D3C80_2076590 [compost metagenome]
MLLILPMFMPTLFIPLSPAPGEAAGCAAVSSLLVCAAWLFAADDDAVSVFELQPARRMAAIRPLAII